MPIPDMFFGNNIDDILKPDRVLYVSKDMSLSDIKMNAKRHNATVNDWFTACMVKAIKEYYESHNENKTPISEGSTTAVSGILP